jgi:RNA polymerase sigma-70 factor (ECF subfamily)
MILNKEDILFERMKASDDQKAFEYFYFRYFSSLCLYVDGFVKNRADSEDIVNDCFYEFWKNRKTLVIRSSIKAYFFITVRNRAINLLKKKASSQKYLTEQSYPFAFQEEISLLTEQVVNQENLEQILKKAIEQLPSQCRYIFYLNRFEGLKYKEIAKKMNLAEATVKTQVARALKSLRDDLENFRTTLLLFLLLRNKQ